AYDRLGRHRPGEEFRPPPDWARAFAEQFGGPFGRGGFSFDDIDLEDLFAGFTGARGARRAGPATAGEDYEVTAAISVEEAWRGAEVEVRLALPETDALGRVRRVPRTFRVRIPKGASEGQRLRLAGRGGKGRGGGRDGDLYVNIVFKPHPFFRVSGHDVYLDLPLAPWEAVLGTEVEIPPPGGPVRLRVPPHTQAGQQLRLAGRGLPRPSGPPGALYAVARIVVPPAAG